MDILTQGVLGAVLAQSVASKEEIKKASLVGFLAGLLADADILIASSSDPLLNIEFHRHFTHSLFFIPLGALVAALILWPFIKNQLKPTKLYLYSLLGFSMSGFLDACTSYGTHLLWPLSNERISFNIISIIDPVFSGMLIIALIYTFKTTNNIAAKVGLALCAVYLSLGLFQSHRAQGVADDLMASRGHVAELKLVKPTLGNIILWRSVYLYEKNFYVDALRAGWFSSATVYPGSSVKKLEPEKDLPGIDINSVMYSDIQRFSKFSNDYIALDASKENVIGDVRYSMLPQSIKPLWGIIIDPRNQDNHAEYRFFRTGDAQLRQDFINMLFGSYDE